MWQTNYVALKKPADLLSIRQLSLAKAKLQNSAYAATFAKRRSSLVKRLQSWRKHYLLPTKKVEVKRKKPEPNQNQFVIDSYRLSKHDHNKCSYPDRFIFLSIKISFPMRVRKFVSCLLFFLFFCFFNFQFSVSGRQHFNRHLTKSVTFDILQIEGEVPRNLWFFSARWSACMICGGHVVSPAFRVICLSKCLDRAHATILKQLSEMRSPLNDYNDPLSSFESLWALIDKRLIKDAEVYSKTFELS